MRAVWLVVAACGGGAVHRAPEPAPRPAIVEIGVRPLAPRPALALADVLPPQGLPWPLVEPPSLAPHWEVAREACNDEWRARHSHDADGLAYGAAWCRIRAQDRGAIDELGRLARDARPDIARAALLDSIDLAADAMSARRALAWLDSHSLATPHALDLLAATYVANGQRSETQLVDDRLAHDDPQPPAAAVCERQFRGALLGDTRVTHELAATKACDARAWAAICIVDIRQRDMPACEHSFASPDDYRARVEIVDFYQHWTDDPAQLVDIARAMRKHFEIAPVEDIAVTALENALRASRCVGGVVNYVMTEADKLRQADGHSSAFDARLDALRPFVQELCDRRTTSTP